SRLHMGNRLQAIHVLGIATIPILAVVMLGFRSNLPDSHSTYPAIRILQTTDVVLVFATALIGVVLHRISQDVAGGEMATFLRCLVFYLLLRPVTFVARSLFTDFGPPGAMLFFIAAGGAAQWMFALAIFHRWRLTQRVAQLAERYS